MRIRSQVLPFLLASLVISAVVFGALVFIPATESVALPISAGLFTLMGLYLLWFFRDPVRIPPADPNAILSGADGVVAKITTFTTAQFDSITMLAGLHRKDIYPLKKKGDILRISIFLSLFDVHVNRVPISGKSRFLGYFPGKHLFTFEEKSSDVNQHNSILIENKKICCLVNQIVGPVCRRVVYWLDHKNPTNVKAGDDFGMMKFGSRMDIYFPAASIEVLVKEGDRVKAGVSIIGRYR